MSLSVDFSAPFWEWNFYVCFILFCFNLCHLVGDSGFRFLLILMSTQNNAKFSFKTKQNPVSFVFNTYGPSSCNDLSKWVHLTWYDFKLPWPKWEDFEIPKFVNLHACLEKNTRNRKINGKHIFKIYY